ncbi:MAG: hypothetical protein HOC71_18250 [Candidatus Latescibacteria bacterium]|nr:hypothetical protein [Candidatus Latescibacterota bacterium]
MLTGQEAIAGTDILDSLVLELEKEASSTMRRCRSRPWLSASIRNSTYIGQV